MGSSSDEKKTDVAKGAAREQIDYDFPWWMKTLAAIGGVAVVGILVTLFFSLGRRPADIQLTQEPPVDSPDFMLALAGIAGSPIRSGGTARLLDNGNAFFPALLEAIRGAQKTINFAVYIWEPGKASDQVIGALIERAKAGVQVRIMLDGMGGLKAPEEDMDRLRAAGGKVETFRAARLGKLSRFHKRNHRRSIVIDGNVAFTGGMAVGDKWLGNASTEEEWRDSMVMVTGPMAATVQSAFVDNWAHIAGEMLVGPEFFPPAPPVPAAGEVVAMHTGLASSPSSENHPMRLFYLQTFAAARQKLFIAASYFVPDETVRKTVMKKAREGVDVRILLPDEHTDAKPIRQTGHRYYEDLIEAGVK